MCYIFFPCCCYLGTLTDLTISEPEIKPCPGCQASYFIAQKNFSTVHTAFCLVLLGTAVQQRLLNWKKSKKKLGTDIRKAEARYRSCILKAQVLCSGIPCSPQVVNCTQFSVWGHSGTLLFCNPVIKLSLCGLLTCHSHCSLATIIISRISCLLHML